MEIRNLGKSEIRNTLALVWSVFQEFEAPEYSDEGVEEFKKFIEYDSIIEKFDQGAIHFWGCFADNDLTGVIATRETNHICLLFVKKEYHRKGIARALLQAVVEASKSRNNFGKITVNSSPYAVEAYHHLGFVETDTEQTVNGIRFTPMAYLIN